MTADWHLSKHLEDQIVVWLEDYERYQQKITHPVYPSIMWSLGGEAWKSEDPEGTRIPIPAGYSVGFYNQNPLPEGDSLIFVKSDRFGLVVFLPRPEDQASSRRLIDFDGEEVIVR